MARARNRSNIPSPETVLLEFRLPPPSAAAAPAAAVRPRTEYRVFRTNQVDEYETPVTMAAFAAAARPRRRPGDTFQGTARRAAKISIADADVEHFDDIKDLIDSFPAESDMIRHTPRITTDRTSNRVDEEKRNVEVRAFLYAASREEDNDFHLIVGRAPNRTATYMTMEISGLPPANSRHRATLERARNDFKSFLESHPLGLPGTSYDFYDPPIPVEIAGSLFFDMSHARGGRPGPTDLRDDMPTIWEVHPVTKIVFEP